MTVRSPRRAALYARYSTEQQSEHSVEDQFRVCARLAEKEGFEVATRFSDAAISGGTANRPGYQRMLEAARYGEFDVILAEDTSRLWRELSELWRALKELADRGIDVVTQDVDTRRAEYKMLLSVTGAASEAHRDEIARRTRRGLEGRAVAGASTGGRAFGYTAASASGTGRVEINDAEAAVVTRIFEMYSEGNSPRAIAACLNAEGVPSPGASWARTAVGPNAKRRSKWVASAIHGDVSRGIGILNNERYVGRVAWGRTRWRRGAADSLRRSAVRVEDPSLWVTREEPRLRIVPQTLWDRVKARQAAISKRSENIRVALTGRRATSLLSGLLECASCGSHFIAVDRNFYGCASYKQGGPAACLNTARVKRQHVEDVLLQEIMAEILSDEAVALAQEDIRTELRRLRSRERVELPTPPRIAQLDAQAGELRAMLKAGKLTPVVAQAALDAIERQRSALSGARREEQRATAQVIQLLPKAAAVYRSAVRSLNATLSEPEDRTEARALIGNLLGGRVKIRQEGSAVYAQLEMDASVLLAEAANSGKFKDFKRGSGGRI